MKKNIYSLIAMAIISTGVVAQVEIKSSNLAEIGDIIYYESDSSYSGSIDMNASGTNQTWDFSNAVKTDGDTISLIDPAGLPGAGIFPNANLAAISEDSSWIFLEKSTTGFNFLGGYGISGGKADTSILNMPFISLPALYGGKSKTTMYTEEEKDTLFPGLGLDSFNIKVTVKVEQEMDGEGHFISPNGTFNALRQKVEFVNYVYIDIYSAGSWDPASPSILTAFGIDTGRSVASTELRWWSDDPNIKFYLASADTSGNQNSIDYSRESNSNAPTNVGISHNANSVNIYPMPANNNLNILNKVKGNRLVSIYDVTGKAVVIKSLNFGVNTFNTSVLMDGIYFYEIQNLNGDVTANGKLSVVH